MKTILQNKMTGHFWLLLMLLMVINTVHSQTISPSTPIPSSSEVGSAVQLNFNYTSSEACKIRVDLWLVDINNGVISNTYCCYQAGQASVSLPAGSGTGSVTVNIPGNLTLSANLPSGKTYDWDYKLLKVSDDSYLTGVQVATTIVASTSVVDFLSLNTPPASINTGETITVTVNYTCPSPRLIKFGISKFSSSGNFINDLVGTGVDNLPATTTTAVSLSQELVIPADAIPSSELQNGEYYKVDTALFTPGYASYITGTNTPITVNSSLKTTGFSKNTVKIAPNPVKSMLSINSDLDYNSISIYDVLGKKLLEFNKATISNNGIDVASLKKGVYFLITDTNQKAKFIKD